MKQNFTVRQGALDGVEAFMSVAQHRNFRKAAAELGVTPSAISQAVRALEARIGAALFIRTTRSVGLTEAGERFISRAKPAFEELVTAGDAARDLGQRPNGLLAQSRLGKTWRITFFTNAPPESVSGALERISAAFVQGMRELGHREGQDFIIDYAVVHDADKPDEAAREMVQHHVDLILALTQSDIVLAAKRATRDIPIVFVVAGDPVANGIVASMSRPGGNATLLTSLNASADAKRQEMLKEAMPAVRRVALLASRGDPATSSIGSAAGNAARSLGVELQIRSVDSIDNLEGTLTAVVKAGSEAVIVAGSPVFFPLQPRIAQWAGAERTPVISVARASCGGWSLELWHQRQRDVPSSGGLRRSHSQGQGSSNPPDRTADHIRAGLKTAKALGLTVPPSLLARADELIE